MLTLMVGLAMSCLDTAIVNVALPVIAKDLHADPADSIWVVNAYQLAVMVSLLPFASFGDIFGYRRVYRFGLVLYTAAALISATAGSLEMLILGRALQGLGAAGVMSVNTALVRYTYPRRQLGRGIAMVSLVVSVSSASGPSVAAAILRWRRGRGCSRSTCRSASRRFCCRCGLLPYTPPSEHRFDLWSAVLCAADVRVPDQRHQRHRPRPGRACRWPPSSPRLSSPAGCWCSGSATRRCRCCRSICSAGRSSRCR